MVKPPIYAKSAKLKEGTVLSDDMKSKWVLGCVLGQGGFGCIYSAKSEASQIFDKVIKIEPRSNGPLFTEINFYKRVAKDEYIKKWVKEKNIIFLGMPKFISCGISDDNRFLVMDRFGDDLHKSLMNGHLSIVCLLQIAINMLDILEYIHSKEYAHADIKALNIMRGHITPSEVYLLDFGMTSKFSDHGVHKPEERDPKCKNNGTHAFSPRDSHAGLLPSRRGDIESLLYNVIFWLTWNEKNPNSSRFIGFGQLPWLPLLQGLKSEKVSISVINKVAESKLTHMDNPKKFIETVGLHMYAWSKYLVKMLTEISKYKYCEQPNYDSLRKDIAIIISDIDEEPLNVNVNRKVNWEHKVLSTKTKILLKRPSSEIEGRSKDNISKRKREIVSKVLNNSNTQDEDIMPISSEIKCGTKKVSNIFKNFTDKEDSENLIKVMNYKSIDDESIGARKMNKIEKKMKTVKKGIKANVSHNKSEVIVDEMNLSSVNHDEIIPGRKQIDQLILRNKLKPVVSEISIRPYPKRNSKKDSLGIIPGLKDIRRHNTVKTPHIKNQSSSAPTNSVSCQTTPTISKNQ